MKRADIILGVMVLVLCTIWFCSGFFLQKQGAGVVVEQNGETYGYYALTEDREVDIGAGNHITIRDGYVQMTHADCPDQICVRQGKVNTQGSSIICLPNRVVVKVTGSDRSGNREPDAIAY